MKKLLISLWLMASIWISFSPAQAEEKPEEVEITEEETPQSSGQRQQIMYQGSLIVMFALAVGITAVVIAKRERPIELSVTGVKDNGDGSVTVTWGYRNPNFKKVTAEKMDLRVNRGAAIILKQKDSKEFFPGQDEEALITVVNRDTSLEWIVNDQKLKIEGSELIDKAKKVRS